jgi:hypothetical protein
MAELIEPITEEPTENPSTVEYDDDDGCEDENNNCYIEETNNK